MSKPKTVPRNLSARQIAIIIASLRIAQWEGMGRLNAMEQLAVDGHKDVEDPEIDNLCVYLNLGGKE